MDLRGTMGALERAGTEENRRVYRRHGARGDVFGVGPASLDAIAQKVGTDQKLAKALWATGNADARILATMIADPARVTPAELASWAKALDWYVGADALAKLVFHTKHAKAVALEWIESRGEWTKRAGWHALALLTRDKSLPDAFFDAFLVRIEKGIHKAPNRARDAMNAALIAIGIRSDDLAKRATAAASRIGAIDVDYGDIKTKTPPASAYIRRARAWLRSMVEARKSARKRTKKKPAKRAKVAATKQRRPARAAKKKAAKKKAAKKKRAPSRR